MSTTVHLALQTHTGFTTHVKRPNTLGAIHLMTRKAHQVDVPLIDVNLDMTWRLGRVAVEQDLMFATNLANGFHILNNANFVIDRHDGNQNRIGTNRGTQRVQVEQTIFLNIQVRHFEAFAFQMTHGVQNSLMFGLHRNQVTTFVFVKVSRAFKRQIVGFSRSRRPHDLTGIRTD